jgi:hypothetical protein
MSRDFLVKTAMVETLMFNGDNMKMLQEAMLGPSAASGQVGEDKLTLVAGWGTGKMWKLSNNSWAKMRISAPTNLAGASFESFTVRNQTEIIISGIVENGYPSNRVFSYSVATKTWLELPQSQYSRQGHFSMMFRDCLYLIGGTNMQGQ